jgi:hypothetical protein
MNITMNNSFELEGIEIRIQQKPLAEFVEQSANIIVDYTANPKIYFEDGNLYFYDQTIEEPVALSKIVNYYERIRYVDGELRFYEKDLSTYINLSFFTSTRTTFVDKPNALINNQVRRITRNNTFDSTEQFLSALYLETGIKDMSGEPILTAISGVSGMELVDLGIRAILNDFECALFDSTLSETGETVFDFLVNNYTYGLGKHSDEGFGINSSIFNLDKGEFISKVTAFNDKLYALKKQKNTAESARILGNEYFSTLVTELAQIFQSFDGVGNLLHKFFGKKNEADIGNGFDIITQCIQQPGGGTFTVDASANGFSCTSDGTTPISLGTFYKGNLAFKYKYGQITSNVSTGIYNTPLGSSYCSDRTSVSVVETTLGSLEYNDITIFGVSNNNEVLAWFRTPGDTTTPDGDVSFEYVFTPTANSIKQTFVLDAVTMVDFTQESEYLSQTWTDGEVSSPRRKMIGVFEPGVISFNIVSGYVRPDQEYETVYNDIQSETFQTFIDDISGSMTVEYGFVNTNLGRINFNETVTYDFSETTAVEVWYEDFDDSDNDGQLTITYKYTAQNQVSSSGELIINYDGFIRDPRYKHLLNYSLDHFARIVSFGLSSLWYDALFDEFKAKGYVEEGSNQIGNIEAMVDDTITIETLLEAVDTRFTSILPVYEHIMSNFLHKNFFEPKVFYEDVQLTDIEVAEGKGIIDFRNYFLYSGGSGISNENLIYRSLNDMNDVWLDVPDTFAVVPKVPNRYALSALVNFTADYRSGAPCELEFRLWDSTSQTELDRVIFDFNRISHTDQIGDLVFENKEPLHIQLAYFGPMPTLKCDEQKFKQFCETANRNVNQHVVVDEGVIFTDDAVDMDAFEIIADRVTRFLKAKGVDAGSKIVELEAPRVLRVQWRMRFSDEVSSKPQLIYDLPQFTFDRYAPENENLFTVNVYAFGDVYGKGLTVRGLEQFTGKQKRVTVSGDNIAIMPDEKYSISLSPSKNINVWVENKSSTSFDIVAEKEFVGEVSWIAIRQRTDIDLVRPQEDPKLLPSCVVERQYRYSAYTDLEILKMEGYYSKTEGILGETENTTEADGLVDTPPSMFIDPNGVRCSQECFDDCPEDYICSPDCYTASLTQSGCGCCQCIVDNDCPPGYICDEVNECIPV